MKKISIITVCRNAEQYIEETILSVLNQTVFLEKRASLEYIIRDGNSDDKTCEKIAACISAINLENISISFSSSPDGGMYEALANGLACSTGDINAYINAGDFYDRNAFDIVLDVFDSYPACQWCTGIDVIYNDASQIVGATLPFRYRKKLIQAGFYGGFLPIIQQESTFWSSSLSKKLDLSRLKNYRYAGDAYIWWTFSHFSEPYIINAYLAGFRIHENQLSSNTKGYEYERISIAMNSSLTDWVLAIFDRIIFYMPLSVKKFFNASRLLTYDHSFKKWK